MHAYKKEKGSDHDNATVAAFLLCFMIRLTSSLNHFIKHRTFIIKLLNTYSTSKKTSPLA